MVFVDNGDSWKPSQQVSPAFDSLVQVMKICQKNK